MNRVPQFDDVDLIKHSIMNSTVKRAEMRQASTGSLIGGLSAEDHESSDLPLQTMREMKLGTKIPPTQKTGQVMFSFCREYAQHKSCKKVPRQVRHLLTKSKYRKKEGEMIWSKRLFLAKETVLNEERRMRPILIINIDGAMGFWDDLKSNYYVLRPKALDSLIQLSYDFRIIAISCMKKKRIFPLIYGLMNIPVSSDALQLASQGKAPQMKHLFFDAVYQLKS